MSQYHGYFKVISQWPSAITGTAQHRTTDYGTTVLSFTNLQPGAASAVSAQFTTSTTNVDRWSISFTDASGRLYTANGNCGFESEDNNGTVQLLPNFPEMELMIVMPVSSGCSDDLK